MCIRDRHHRGAVAVGHDRPRDEALRVGQEPRRERRDAHPRAGVEVGLGAFRLTGAGSARQAPAECKKRRTQVPLRAPRACGRRAGRPVGARDGVQCVAREATRGRFRMAGGFAWRRRMEAIGRSTGCRRRRTGRRTRRTGFGLCAFLCTGIAESAIFNGYAIEIEAGAADFGVLACIVPGRKNPKTFYKPKRVGRTRITVRNCNAGRISPWTLPAGFSRPVFVLAV